MVTKPPPDGPRQGDTYDDTRDRDRLNRQARLVWRVMTDHQWHTLAELSFLTDQPEASVSARLRDLRKRRFGSHTVHRRYAGGGLWEYQLDDPPTTDQGADDDEPRPW